MNDQEHSFKARYGTVSKAGLKIGIWSSQMGAAS